MAGRFNNKSSVFFSTQCTDVFCTILIVNFRTQGSQTDILAGVHRVLCEVQTESVHAVQSTVNTIRPNHDKV
jgi:activator of 2-hydroxyglutaryl-CoA dehydratase